MKMKENTKKEKVVSKYLVYIPVLVDKTDILMLQRENFHFYSTHISVAKTCISYLL